MSTPGAIAVSRSAGSSITSIPASAHISLNIGRPSTMWIGVVGGKSFRNAVSKWSWWQCETMTASTVSRRGSITCAGKNTQQPS